MAGRDSQQLAEKSQKTGNRTDFFLAAIITPPDIASQVMVALPMVLLFPLGIVMSALCEKTKKKTAEAVEE